MILAGVCVFIFIHAMCLISKAQTQYLNHVLSVLHSNHLCHDILRIIACFISYCSIYELHYMHQPAQPSHIDEEEHQIAPLVFKAIVLARDKSEAISLFKSKFGSYELDELSISDEVLFESVRLASTKMYFHAKPRLLFAQLSTQMIDSYIPRNCLQRMYKSFGFHRGVELVWLYPDNFDASEWNLFDEPMYHQDHMMDVFDNAPELPLFRIPNSNSILISLSLQTAQAVHAFTTKFSSFDEPSVQLFVDDADSEFNKWYLDSQDFRKGKFYHNLQSKQFVYHFTFVGAWHANFPVAREYQYKLWILSFDGNQQLQLASNIHTMFVNYGIPEQVLQTCMQTAALQKFQDFVLFPTDFDTNATFTELCFTGRGLFKIYFELKKVVQQISFCPKRLSRLFTNMANNCQWSIASPEEVDAFMID